MGRKDFSYFSKNIFGIIKTEIQIFVEFILVIDEIIGIKIQKKKKKEKRARAQAMTQAKAKNSKETEDHLLHILTPALLIITR